MLFLLNPFLARGPHLAAGLGTFQVVGQDARFLSSLYADPGAFALTGQAAGFPRALRLDAAAGAVLIDGQLAALIYNKPFPAFAGAFELTGNEAQVLRSLMFAAETGAITVTGEDAAFLRTMILMAAAAGSFVLAGQDAIINKGLVATPGAFTFDGQEAALARSARLPGAVGAFSMSGQVAPLEFGARLGSTAGSFTVTGQVATLRVIRSTYRGIDYSTTAGATRIFTSAPIGGASNDRLVIATIFWALTGSTTLSSATIGGNAATIIGQASGANCGQAIIYLNVTSGTVATIEFTMAASVARAAIMVETLVGQTVNTPYSNHFPAGGAAASRTATLDIPAAGLAIVRAGGSDLTDGTFTNAVEDFDSLQTNERLWGGHAGTATLLTARAISHSNCRIIGAASWR